jgi:hypothetical protein
MSAWSLASPGPVRTVASLVVAIGLVRAPQALAQKPAPSGTTAAQAMLAPDQHETSLTQRVGSWRVTSTLRLTPDAKPIVQTAIADRTMIGPYLQEVMRSAPNSGAPDFRRISYLTFFRVEGRWHYVSIDTRFPVGVMPAYSFEAGARDTIELQFEPLAFVGLGNKVEGRMIRSNFIITWDGPNRDVARQYWIAADGSGRKWLAVQYDYVRVKK